MSRQNFNPTGTTAYQPLQKLYFPTFTYRSYYNTVHALLYNSLSSSSSVTLFPWSQPSGPRSRRTVVVTVPWDGLRKGSSFRGSYCISFFCSVNLCRHWISLWTGSHCLQSFMSCYSFWNAQTDHILYFNIFNNTAYIVPKYLHIW